jgi:uncharacterized protein (DUF305 family)
VVIAVGTACVSACAHGTASETAASASAAPSATTTTKRASPADAEFMSGMIHHHAQALVMARWAPTHDASPSVRTLCERIIVSQTDEIRTMQQWLREHGEEAPEPSPTGQHMNMGGMEHDMLMPGMLSPDQMKQLDAARGGEFDRFFLEFMIQHHDGALQMVQKLFDTYGGGVDDLVYKFASDTFADQGSEIGRMQRMLDAMGAGGR